MKASGNVRAPTAAVARAARPASVSRATSSGIPAATQPRTAIERTAAAPPAASVAAAWYSARFAGGEPMGPGADGRRDGLGQRDGAGVWPSTATKAPRQSSSAAPVNGPHGMQGRGFGSGTGERGEDLAAEGAGEVQGETAGQPAGASVGRDRGDGVVRDGQHDEVAGAGRRSARGSRPIVVLDPAARAGPRSAQTRDPARPAPTSATRERKHGSAAVIGVRVYSGLGRSAPEF